jgi:hypothetical protein
VESGVNHLEHESALDQAADAMMRLPHMPHRLLGKVLGYSRARDIRRLIERRRSDLERYGPLLAVHSDGRVEYHLNFGQMVEACFRSKANRAVGFQVRIIQRMCAAPPVEEFIHEFCSAAGGDAA